MKKFFVVILSLCLARFDDGWKTTTTTTTAVPAKPLSTANQDHQETTSRVETTNFFVKTVLGI